MDRTEIDALRALLKSLPDYGIKIYDLAKDLNIHPTTVYHYIQGFNIPPKRAKQILHILHLKYKDRLISGMEMFAGENTLKDLFRELGITIGGLQ